MRQNTGAYQVPDKPEIDDLDKAAGRNLQLQTRTHIAATLLTFDPVTQTARVRVDAIPVMIDIETGAELPQNPLEVIVPVRIDGDGEGYLSFPLVAGVTGTLEVHDRGIQQWLRRTIDKAVVPQDRALHQIHDAEFVIGLRTNANRIPVPIDLTAVVLHHSTGIKLGRAAVLGVARRTDTLGASVALTAWATAVEVALAANGVPIAPIATWVALGLAVPNALGSITAASAKVKAE